MFWGCSDWWNSAGLSDKTFHAHVPSVIISMSKFKKGNFRTRRVAQRTIACRHFSIKCQLWPWQKCQRVVIRHKTLKISSPDLMRQNDLTCRQSAEVSSSLSAFLKMNLLTLLHDTGKRPDRFASAKYFTTPTVSVFSRDDTGVNKLMRWFNHQDLWTKHFVLVPLLNFYCRRQERA